MGCGFPGMDVVFVWEIYDGLLAIVSIYCDHCLLVDGWSHSQKHSKPVPLLKCFQEAELDFKVDRWRFWFDVTLQERAVGSGNCTPTLFRFHLLRTDQLEPRCFSWALGPCLHDLNIPFWFVLGIWISNPFSRSWATPKSNKTRGFFKFWRFARTFDAAKKYQEEFTKA